MTDREIGEVRRIRHEISEEAGHDVHKVAAYYRLVEVELRASGEFRFEEVFEPARRAAAHEISSTRAR